MLDKVLRDDVEAVPERHEGYGLLAEPDLAGNRLLIELALLATQRLGAAVLR
jgi:hypothetical protein